MNCANCGATMERTVIRLEQTYFRNCGDHDEKIVDLIVTVCSWSCAQLAAADISGELVTQPETKWCRGSVLVAHERDITNEGEVPCPVCHTWQPIARDAMVIVQHPFVRNAAASGTF